MKYRLIHTSFTLLVCTTLLKWNNAHSHFLGSLWGKTSQRFVLWKDIWDSSTSQAFKSFPIVILDDATLSRIFHKVKIFKMTLKKQMTSKLLSSQQYNTQSILQYKNIVKYYKNIGEKWLSRLKHMIMPWILANNMPTFL